MYDSDVVPSWALEQIGIAIETSAKTLNLSGYRQKKKLTKIPPDVFALTHLEGLDLHGNQIHSIPAEIAELTKLQILNLSSNRLTAVPDAMSTLHDLQIIDLRFNGLTKLPAWLVDLPQLEALYLHNNFISDPQPDIVNLTGLWGKADLPKLRVFFHHLAKGEDVLYEAKLIIVGEAGAGKTTLAKKLQDLDYKLVDEVSTEGIDIFRWSFLYTLAGQEKKMIFKVNIWDFGGQQIDYATHRFFLTKDSLYAIVADARKQKTYFYGWLQMVGLFSSQSPTLVIVNENQDRPWSINEQQFRKQFAHFEKILDVNLARKDDRLYELIDEIKHQIARLPLVGKKLPKTWIKVREALEANSYNTMSLQEYSDICEQHGFDHEEDKLELSDYLTKIGVCLHFQEPLALRNLLFLKPQWATDAAYKVLNDRHIRANYGRFDHKDLVRIWNEGDHINKRNELLELMMRFQLCYPLPDTTNSYMLPQLLDNNPPRQVWDEWDDHNKVSLRYRYPDFMPKGILTRLIVSMHKYIANANGQDLVWQTGVVLEQNSTRARAIEYYDQRKLEIQIIGNRKRDLLTVITWELDRIHETFPDLKYHMGIPCNCQQCQKSSLPYFFQFEELKKRMEHQKFHPECGESFQRIDIRNLLNGVGMKQRLVPDDEYGLVFNVHTLVSLLTNHFNRAELRTVSFSLDIDFEEIYGETLSAKARELVLYCQRRRRITALREAIYDVRPFLRPEKD